MSSDERMVWLSEYQLWYADILPAIERASSPLVTDFEKGLLLISVFPYCRSFVNETLRFRDFAARRKSLRRYADKVTADAQMVLANRVDLTDPTLLTPHVGRPTKDEAAARAIKAENDRKKAEAKEETLFGTKADISTINPAAPATVSGTMGGGALLHLDQWKWLLSPELAEAVETIRDLRIKASEAATTAKILAEQGKPADEIEPYSQEAISKTEAYEAIYERVDDELAMAYVRLKEDTGFISFITAQKLDPAQLRTSLRPYWDKVADKEIFKTRVIENIKANDPAQKAIREAEEQRKKTVADIVKYLNRKDKENTPKRIETMTARYQELVNIIGEEEAKVYLPILTAAKEDCEKNVIPRIEQKRAERATRKAAKKITEKEIIGK